MRELTSIEFVFDSCHKINIPIKYFGYVKIYLREQCLWHSPLHIRFISNKIEKRKVFELWTKTTL